MDSTAAIAAAGEFARASEFMRQIADDRHGAALLEFTDAFIHSIIAFGSSEFEARQAERFEVLKVVSPKAGAASQASSHLNAKGLRHVRYGLEAIKAFRNEFDSFPKGKVADTDFGDFERELREALAELDVKPSDVEKIDRTVRESLDEIRGKGAVSLPDFLEGKLAELERVRRREDRGAVDNIPVWKIAAIAVAVGVWVWALFRCTWWGSCSMQEGLVYFVVFWLAVLISRFC
jgi:hypothetical protein